MNLADNLKKIRNDNKLSQEQLAEKLGVSRQSVSKWESGQAYPEMDKVLQICQLFNLNIDELLNQDIKEVTVNKQAKNNINKFVDDFLGYITKTIDMFSSMNFKSKIKCVFEQLVIIGLLILVFITVGAIGLNIVQNIITFLPDKLYFFLFNLLESIYIIIALILGIVLLLHVFKVRYLDYYIIEKSKPQNISEDSTVKNDTETDIKDVKEDKKIILEKKSEKIIIRDPNHSGYKFISGLLNIFLFFIKILVGFIALCFSFSLVCLVIYLVVSLLFIQTGFLFIGNLIFTIGLIIINLLMLIINYNFIISKKNKKSRLGLAFVISLFLVGIGIGFISIGITNFNFINDVNHESYIEDEMTLSMKDNLFFEDYYGMIEYIESNNKDLKIIYKHSKYCDVVLSEYDYDYYYFYPSCNPNFFELIRNVIDDINNKKFINYEKNKVYIYTSKENIQKIKDNRKAYLINREEEINEHNELTNKIAELNEKIDNQEIELNDLKQKIIEKDELINSLNNQLKSIEE